MFESKFTITPKIASALMRIEAARQAVVDLRMTPKVQARLRETARLLSTHYSTQIEGNRLTLNEATRVIEKDEHFCTGMADAFESVQRRAKEEARTGKGDKSQILRQLDARQRKVLDLFRKSDWVTAAQVEKTLGLAGRTARHLCQSWVEQEFFIVVDPSKKARKYGLNRGLARLILTGFVYQ